LQPLYDETDEVSSTNHAHLRTKHAHPAQDTQKMPLPHYQDNFKDFITALRVGLDLTLEQTASYMGIKTHTTIARYESKLNDQIKKIPFNYLIILANLYMERLLDEAEQSTLLDEVNQAIKDHYKDKEKLFSDVATLRQYVVDLPKHEANKQIARASSAPLNGWPEPPAVDPIRTRHRFDSYLSLHDLFGVAAAQTRLMEALQTTQNPWIVMIDGSGGMGKTTLASELSKLCISHFHDVLWLSAKQEKFDIGRGIETLDNPVLSAAMLVDELLTQLDPTFELGRPDKEKLLILAHWFHQKPYLVIIDNLETMADNKALLPTLHHLIRPTKFLLTTRWHEEQDVFYESLTEWSEEDAILFLRYWGKTQAMPSLVDANAADLTQIYQVVGGNPLALKLVTGRLKTHPLTKVLADLKRGQSQNGSDFYNYIYRQAWDDLTEDARHVFVLLLHKTDYEDLARLAKLKQNPEKLSNVLIELSLRSLIEVRGVGLDERTYHLHRLTETFLQTQIIKRRQWA